MKFFREMWLIEHFVLQAQTSGVWQLEGLQEPPQQQWLHDRERHLHELQRARHAQAPPMRQPQRTRQHSLYGGMSLLH